MKSTRRYATGAAVLAATVLAAGAAQAEPAPTQAGDATPAITLDADPGEVTIAPLPCDRRGEIELGMTNTGTSGRFVDALLSAPEGLELSRGIWSTYLPAVDPDQRVPGMVTVTAEAGTPPGEYQLHMAAAGQTLDVPVTVEEAPGAGPGDNLALYRQAFASTVHPHTTLCGGVDGNRDSDQWAGSGIHDRTPNEFPDTFGVELGDTHPINRVEVYTLNSERYPAAEMGVRDFDVQAHTADGWQTVNTIEGNEEGQITVTFAAVDADQVRLVVHDSNDHKYSRIIELEVYAD